MDTPETRNASGYGVLDGDRPPLILPGLYDFRFDYYETKVLFGRAPKLVLWFTVVTFGEYFDRVRLPRYYNLAKLMEKPRKWGRFKVGYKSDFLREYATLFSAPLRLDRIPMSAFEKVMVEGKVRTVSTGSKQEAIPAGLQYSVIGQLVEVKK
jgi:hypothetical protein